MRHWVALALFCFAVLSARPALAQGSTDLPLDFCYSAQGQWQCYASMAEAESAMKAAMPSSYRNVLVPKTPYATGSVSWSTGLEEWRQDYFIPDQPPQTIYPRGYYQGWQGAPAVCTSAGDPLYPHLCASEDGAMNALYEYQRNYYAQCTYVRIGYANEWAQPFARIQRYNWSSPYGVITYTNANLPPSGNRKYLYTVQCPGWNPPDPVTQEINLSSTQTFLCPEEYSPVEGYGAQQYSNGGSSAIISGPLCRPRLVMPHIIFKMKMTETPPVGECPGPCHPATGDKSRNEVDFSFAGEDFTRYYHSLRQTGALPAFAPGWTHTFSDRVLDGGSSKMRIIRADGYSEYFQYLANNEYKSTQTTRKKLVKLGDGTYRIYDETGKVMYFNATGRLIRQERNLSGLQAIDFTYDGERLIRAEDQNGRALTFVYVNSRLDSITLPDGTAVQYDFDEHSNFERASYPDGTSKQYHYNEAGLSLANDVHALTGITAENGLRYSSYGYNANGRVNLSRRHKGDGTYVETTTIDYSNPNQPVATLPYGEVVTYNLSPQGPYTRITSTAGGGGTYLSNYSGTSSSGGALMQLTSPRGDITKYEYYEAYQSARYEGFGTPEERKFVTVRDPGYRTSTLDIQAKSGSSYVTRQRHAYTYNGRGQMLTAAVVDPAASTSRTASLTYCEQADVDNGVCPVVGLLRTIDGPRSDVADVVSFTYRAAGDAACASSPSACLYRKGDLWKVTNALGHVSEVIAADGNGRPVSVQDQNGVVTDIEYDLRGRITAYKMRGANALSETDDRIVRIEYWPTGLVKKVIQPDGAFTTYAYDDAHRLTSIEDNAGHRMVFTLNNASRRTKEETKDPNGVLLRVLNRTYNTLNKLQSVTDAYGRATTFTYDADGNPNLATDALSRVADSDYDGLDRLKRSLQDVNGIAAETTFGYDVLDQLTRVTDPKGLDTTYTYNGLGDQTQLQSPDTGTTTYTYDSAGNRASQTDARGVTTSYGYDALNRLTSVSVPTSSLNIGYVYDSTQTACQTGEGYGIGRLTRINDGSGSTVYCYNRFGDLVRKVQTTNGQSFTLRYQYNAAGQLTGMVYPDGASVDYAYDALGRVSEIGATPTGGTRQVVLTSATYYPFGPVAEWSYGNGRLMKRSLNQNYQPGFVEVVGAGGLSLGYEFDQVGNLKRLRGADQADPPRRVFGYDGLNRLTENRDGVSNALLEGYAYDKTGNRTSATVGATTTPYSYPAGSHRLDSVGATARSYDNVGNTTQIGGTAKEFIYNDLNRMSQYRESGVAKMNYVYNGRGEQVRKHLGSSDTYSVYDEAGRWVGDYSGSGTPVQQLVWFGDLPVAVLEGASTAQKLYYVEADMLGTPRVVVDPVRGTTGTAVWTWDLAGEAFGNTAPNQDPDGDATRFVFNMRFPGQRFDAASGLNYNYFRDYDAVTGRYVESDPIGLRGGISTYGYVGGNSLRNIDPFGLASAGVALPRPIAWPLPRIPAFEIPAWARGLARVGSGPVGVVIGSLWPTPMGVSECEAPGVIFNDCIRRVYSESESNPLTGESGSEVTCPNKKGNRKQTRRYGSDGFPETDTDWDHSHGGLGSPHVHDWGRPSDGSPPTAADRGPGRPPQPGDPGI